MNHKFYPNNTPWLGWLPGQPAKTFKAAFISKPERCRKCGSTDIKVYPDTGRRCRKCGETW